MLGWAYLAPPPKTSADYAAWAQAIGSVLAITVAIGLGVAEAERVSRHRRRDEHSQVLALARSASAASAYLLATLKIADKQSKDHAWTRGSPRIVRADLEGALALLKAIPFGDLRNPDAATAILNMLQTGHAARIYLELVDADVDAGRPVDTGLFDQYASAVAEANGRLHEALPPLTGDRGS